jgi:membrane glycosyltransferase
MGRVHLLMGATSYLVSVVWAASLVVGVVLALQGEQMIPSYFIDKKTLFPIWPVTDPGAALRLLLATMTIVLLPKGLGLMLELKRVRYAREPLGTLRAIFGVALEALYSILLSPILMVTQTVAVFQVLLGRDSGWRPQTRNGISMPFADALRFHWRHTAIGVLLALACWEASPQVVAWMSPVIAGLLLSAPLSWLTSRPAGFITRALLATREARSPPAIIESANRASGEWAARASIDAERPEDLDPDGVGGMPRAA